MVSTLLAEPVASPHPVEAPSQSGPPDPPTARLRSETHRLYDQFVIPNAVRSLTLVRGAGAYVWDETGRRYLDLGGGVAVNSLGHAHPALRATLARQAGDLIHCSGLYYNEWQGRFAQKIVELTGPGKAFFCNSGAEANEALIKLARKVGHATGRFEIVTALNSFHGRTLATLTATGQNKIKQGFDPLPPGFVHVPFNDLNAVAAALTPQTIAVLIEGIQGEGGVFAATPEYLLGLRRLTAERGVLLLMDAVQCGCFRTGRWQSYERLLEGTNEPFQPDAISMAKSLGGGYPLGAIWVREPWQDVFQPGTHGTTYGGSPLACAIGCTVLETIQTEKLDANIRARGEQLLAGLLPLIGTRGIVAVRGCGGLIGLEVAADLPGAVARLLAAGLLLIPAARNTLRFLPPLNVTAAQIEEALEIVRTAL